MKKILAIIIALVMLVALAGCNSASNSPGGSSPAASSGQGGSSNNSGSGSGSGSSSSPDSGSSGGNASTPSSNVTEPVIAEGAKVAEDVRPDPGRKTTANSNDRYPSITLTQNVRINSLSPFYGQDAAMVTSNYAMFEKLLYRLDTVNYGSGLAKSWGYEAGSDTRIAFELYSNIHDWNGERLTSSDVRFSFDAFAASGKATNYDLYDTIEVIDDTHFVLVLKSKIENLVAFESLMNTYIVCEASWDEQTASTTPVGTGPYKLKEYVTDAYIIFTANDDYWNIANPAPWSRATVQELRVDMVLDAAQRLIALLNGTAVNLGGGITSTDLEDFLEGGQYEGDYLLTVLPGGSPSGLQANVHPDSIMSDINLRMAIWWCLDTMDYVYLNGENVTLPLSTVTIPTTRDYDPAWNDIFSYHSEQNLDLAKEYLAKSNYNGESIKVLTKLAPLSLGVIANVTVAQLAKIGVNAEVVQVDHPIMMEMLTDPKNWDLWTYSNSRPDRYFSASVLDFFIGKAYGTVPGYNKGLSDDGRLQELIDISTSSSTNSRQTTLDLINYTVEMGYLYGLFYELVYYAWDPAISEFTVDATMTPILTCLDFYLD